MAAAFVSLAVFLYLPGGIPVVAALRTGRFTWVFLAGAVVGGILCLWHFAMIFRPTLHFFQRSYGRFIFFGFIEVLALLTPVGLGFVSTSLIPTLAY